MPGAAHRILESIYGSFSPGIGQGNLPDPGNGGVIEIKQYGQICEMVSTNGGGETRTLRNPDRSGVRCILRLHSDGGDVVVTAANGFNQAGADEATFNADGEMLELVSVKHTTGFRWEALVNVGSVGIA